MSPLSDVDKEDAAVDDDSEVDEFVGPSWPVAKIETDIWEELVVSDEEEVDGADTEDEVIVVTDEVVEHVVTEDDAGVVTGMPCAVIEDSFTCGCFRPILRVTLSDSYVQFNH